MEQDGEYEKQRLYVTPGLSCYWQIAPHRNDLSFEEWMSLDVKYVKERSFFGGMENYIQNIQGLLIRAW